MGSKLTFERRTDAFGFVFSSADDGNQIARIKHANYPQRERGDQQVNG
jgi:hypothetical protein